MARDGGGIAGAAGNHLESKGGGTQLITKTGAGGGTKGKHDRPSEAPRLPTVEEAEDAESGPNADGIGGTAASHRQGANR